MSRSRSRGLGALAVLLVLALGAGAAVVARRASDADRSSSPTGAAVTTHTVSYDRWSVLVDGRRVLLWSGELHYWRLPSPGLWRDVLEKMRAGGFNAVSVYFHWGYHSPAPGTYDFTGVRDVDRLLDIAADLGMYVIARPGPYINAETDAGGFPGWLLTQDGRARSSAPDYTAAYRDWLRHIDPVIARHQLTNGTGTVLAYQIENEYVANTDPAYMRDIEHQARSDGITVPFLHNRYAAGPTWATGTGAVDLPGQDSYPQRFDCAHPGRWHPLPTLRRLRPDAPLTVPELQGGAFDPWGGTGYAACRRLTGPAYERVFSSAVLAAGATLVNVYMAYGGTSWGWLGDPARVYSSYDYGAAITESRRLTGKYDELKRLGYLVQALAPLARTDPAPAPPVTDPRVHADLRVAPRSHTHVYVLRHRKAASTATDRTHLGIAVLDGTYPRVPQQPGTALTLHGRDARVLLAGYDLGDQRLVYSTSQLMTSARIGGRDVALLYGHRGDNGETVLRYPARPRVEVLAGRVVARWDAERRDLRLNYAHAGLSRVLVTPAGGTPLLLLLATDATAAQFWRQDTNAGAVLVRGPELLRSADLSGATLRLRGDTVGPMAMEVYAAPAAGLSWNGRELAAGRSPDGSTTASLPGPRAAPLPALGPWRVHRGDPETAPAYDDSAWPQARGTLAADAHGFHHGDVWYRGRFTAAGGERALRLTAGTGRAGAVGVWLDGRFVTTLGEGSHALALPGRPLHAGGRHVLALLVENMGHNEDPAADDAHKRPRGLTAASLAGSGASIDWRVQGARGGMDQVRGAYNNGGLDGERRGWHLPGYPDGGWARVRLPHRDPRPGVAWYRTTFDPRLPRGQDVPIGVRLDDGPIRGERVLLFVNGWLVRRYVGGVGPQHSFPVPAGILRPRADNTVALAVWSTRPGVGGLGTVRLVRYGNLASALRVPAVLSPAYDPSASQP